jgi:hypothetical protein
MSRARLPLDAAQEHALHVLRRATHGPAPSDWLAVQAAGGIQGWLAEQLLDVPDVVCDAEVALRFPMTVPPPAGLQASQQGAVTFEPHQQVAAAHLFRQLTSSRQLYEQVVDVFFNRLNVPYTVDSGVWTYPSYYRDVIRGHAFGRYADMVAAMIRHGSMLEYLNAARSHKKSPNENLGRELLELHTVSVAAGFTQRDVRQAALVLTGLSIDTAAGEYLYRPDMHHTGAVRVLRWSSPNRDANGEAVALDLVDYLTHHPSCARHIARTLAVRFVSDTPSAKLVSDLAAVYLAHDTAIVPVLQALFAHPEFAKSVGAKVRRPSQQTIALARTCGVAPTGAEAGGSLALLHTLSRSGDALLNRPSPDGLPDVAVAWSSTGARMAALDAAGGTLDGWGPGLSTPDATTLRPGLPHETGGLPWLPVTPVTTTQVLDALARRHLGRPLPTAHRAPVAKAAGWSLTAPAAPLTSYDPGLPVAVALLAGHPLHLVR